MIFSQKYTNKQNGIRVILSVCWWFNKILMRDIKFIFIKNAQMFGLAETLTEIILTHSYIFNANVCCRSVHGN